MAGSPFTDGQPVDGSARDAALRGPAGPCTEAVASGMPEGNGHDHTKPEQHDNLACRIEQVASDSLKDELAGGGNPLKQFPPDSVLGEMDVKKDIAAIAITYPNAGILFFDVSDPASPEFLSATRAAPVTHSRSTSTAAHSPTFPSTARSHSSRFRTSARYPGLLMCRAPLASR